jgi:hypothetical protein
MLAGSHGIDPLCMRFFTGETRRNLACQEKRGRGPSAGCIEYKRDYQERAREFQLAPPFKPPDKTGSGRLDGHWKSLPGLCPKLAMDPLRASAITPTLSQG